MCLYNSHYFRLNVSREVLLHVEARHFVVRVAYLDGRNSSIRRVCRDVVKHHCTGPDLCAIANVDIAKQLRVGAEHNAVTDFRVTVANFIACTAQGHSMQEAHVVPDGCSFTNHDVCGMVDQKPVADLCCRVDVHAEFAADDILEHLCREMPVLFPQNVGYAVSLQSLKSLEQKEWF